MKVFAFAYQAGSAEALAPVICALEARGDTVEVLSGPSALKAFAGRGVRAREVTRPEALAGAMDNVDAVLTGTSWAPEFEAGLWQAARGAGILSVAHVDSWVNYWQRFTVPVAAARFNALPDVVGAVDDEMAESLIREGCPADRICVVGHPGLETLGKSDEVPGEELIRILQASPGHRVVLWVADGIFAPPPVGFPTPAELGYNDEALLREVVEAINQIGETERVLLLCRRHPASPDPTLEPMLAEARFPFDFVDRLGKDEVLSVADLVIGGSSMILLEAELMSRTVVRMLRPDDEPASRRKVRTYATSGELSERILDGLKNVSISRVGKRLVGDSVNRILRLLKQEVG